MSESNLQYVITRLTGCSTSESMSTSTGSLDGGALAEPPLEYTELRAVLGAIVFLGSTGVFGSTGEGGLELGALSFATACGVGARRGFEV